MSAAAGVLAAGLVLLWYWFVPGRTPRTGLLEFGAIVRRVRFRWYLVLAGVYLALLVPLAFGAYHSARYYPDSDCILGMLDRGVLYHLKPYVDFEYLYGPLLLFPFLLVNKIAPSIPLEMTYYTVGIGLMLIGLFFIYLVVNELCPDSSPKTVIFIVTGLLGINFLLGAHETFARHLAVFAAIVLLARVERSAVFPTERARYLAILIYLTVSSALVFLISPELIFVYSAAICCYIVASMYFRSWKAIGFVLGPLLGFALAMPLLGVSFLGSVRKFGGGDLDFIVVPSPAILVYLTAFIFLAPMAIAAVVRRGHPELPVIAAYWAAAVVLIVPALARCVWLYNMWAGMGLFLLVFAHLGAYSKKVQYGALAVWAGVFLAHQLTWFVTFAGPMGHTFYSGLTAVASPKMVDVAIDKTAKVIPGIAWRMKLVEQHPDRPVRELPAEVRGQAVAMPYITDKETTRTLQQARSFQPEYFTGMCQSGGAEFEQAKIESVAQARWVLIPKDPPLEVMRIDMVRKAFLYPLEVRNKNEPTRNAQAIYDYVTAHYHVAQRIGDYDLFVKNE